MNDKDFMKFRTSIMAAMQSLAEARVKAETIQLTEDLFSQVTSALEELSEARGVIHTYDMFLGLRMVRGDLNLVLTAPEFGQYRLLELS